MDTIPTTIDEIDAKWLASVTGLPVDDITVTCIGQGIGVSSAVYRLDCEGEGCPASVVVKLPALDEAAVFTSTILRMYIREVRFFEELAEQSPIRVPKGYYGAVDEETSSFVVVMEDLGALRIIDQTIGMEIGDAERCVDALARWHAQWWGRAEPVAERGSAVSLADPIYPAVLPMVFGEGWAKMQEEMADIPEQIRSVAPGWTDVMPAVMQSLASSPTTLIHGDYRADNILFDDDDNVVLLDFQLTGVGSGSYDLAYFVTQSLAPEVAAANEAALFERYRRGLVDAGVPEVDTDRLWEDYRQAALFCLVYPVVACRGMDLDEPRQRSLIDNMFTRYSRAVDELELADLLR